MSDFPEDFTIRLFTVRREQSGDAPPEEFTQSSPGSIQAAGDLVRIRYREEDTGADAEIITGRERVVVKRRCGTGTVMELRLNTRTYMDYDTGYGILPMTVYCTGIENSLTSAGGRLSFSYTLTMGGDKPGAVTSIHRAEIVAEKIV